MYKIQEQELKLREQRYNRTCMSQPRYPITHGYCPLGQQYRALRHSEPSGTDSSASVDVLLGNLSLRASLRSDLLAAEHAICETDCTNDKIICPIIDPRDIVPEDQQRDRSMDENSCSFAKIPTKVEMPAFNADGHNANVARVEKSFETHIPQGDGDCKQPSRLSLDYEQEFGNEENSTGKQVRLSDWDPSAVERHIENEEWVAFLQRSMEEVMDGEIESVLQENCVSVFVSPLRNPAVGCRVVEYVACLLSLPFVAKVSRQNLDKIERIYLDVRVVPNLVYAMKLLMSDRAEPSEDPGGTATNTSTRSAGELSADELQALECAMLVLCRLVYAKEQFLTQFCDAVYIVKGMPFLQQLLTLEKRKARIVTDLVAVLNNVLRLQPENAELVERVVLRTKTLGGAVELFTKLLTHRQTILRARTCTLLRLFGRFCCRALQQVWGKELRNLLEALALDDDESVRNVRLV